MEGERKTGRKSGCYSEGQRTKFRAITAECTREIVGILKGSCICKKSHTTRVDGENARILSKDSELGKRAVRWQTGREWETCLEE